MRTGAGRSPAGADFSQKLAQRASLFGPPLSYAQSLRVLLAGVCGANVSLVARETGVSRPAIIAFLQEERPVQSETLDRMAAFVWRQLNAHLLISDEDRA